jgi:hypothetical protein
MEYRSAQDETIKSENTCSYSTFFEEIKMLVCLSFGVSETLITFRDGTDKNKVI